MNQSSTTERSIESGTARPAGEVRAVIDVGTNSVKFLVATVDGNVVRPLDEGSEQTRLGQGFYETHVLQSGAIEQTVAAVADFAAKARVWQPASVRVIATSAARDATNRDELLNAIQARGGLRVEVISGEQEADWAFEGVTSDPALSDRSLLVIDIGGGSTEFTAGRKGHRTFGQSFKLGTVRYLERNAVSDPPTTGDLRHCEAEARALLETSVRPVLAPVLADLTDVQFVGTAGTSTIMARIHRRLRGFNRELIDGAVMSRADVRAQLGMLWNTPLEARRNIIGLPSNRADVILPGVVIIDQVMDIFSLPNMRVSTRGLRFGALMH